MILLVCGQRSTCGIISYAYLYSIKKCKTLPYECVYTLHVHMYKTSTFVQKNKKIRLNSANTNLANQYDLDQHPLEWTFVSFFEFLSIHSFLMFSQTQSNQFFQ